MRVKVMVFFYVNGHGIPDSLLKEVRDIRLPTVEKSKIKLSDSTRYRGYQCVGENITQDNHEAIDYYRVLERGEYGGLLAGNNQWPIDPPQFKNVMEKYVECCTVLSRQIMRGISLALGCPMNQFEVHITSDPFWVMRILGYPDALSTTKDSCLPDKNSGAHTDYGLLTLKIQDPDKHALEVCNFEGQWISVVPIPGTFVCNFGDMLKILTNGIFKATLHRVINSSQEFRVCVAYFFETNFDAEVTPLSKCIMNSGGNEISDRAIYSNHLVNKFQELRTVERDSGGLTRPSLGSNLFHACWK